jgi:hypothetical protein
MVGLRLRVEYVGYKLRKRLKKKGPKEESGQTEAKGETEKGELEREEAEPAEEYFEKINKYEHITLMDKPIQLVGFELLSELVAWLVFELLLSGQKCMERKELERRYMELMGEPKENSGKTSLYDFQKIMGALGLVDMNENPNSVQWIGPDCINLTGVTEALLGTNSHIHHQIVDNYRSFSLRFPLEMPQREASFFHSMYHSLTSDSMLAVDTTWFKVEPLLFREQPQLSPFGAFGFAVLKNKNFNYLLTRPVVIIGSTKRSKETDFSWQVDLNLFPDPYVSKQHAAIMFNFQTERFEIKCLSERNSIRLRDKSLAHSDEPFQLEENCSFRIGKQWIWFSMTGEEEAINNEEIEDNV